MALQTIHIRKTYTSTAGQTIFVYDFLIHNAAHLSVTVNAVPKLLTTDYTVTNVNDPDGGNVIFNAGLNLSDVVIITRIVPLTQETDFVPNDPLPADTLEASLDKLTMACQQIQDSVVVGGGGGAADAVAQALVAHVNDTADTVHGVGTKISNHNGLDTGVHGVGASTVESASGAQTKVDTHGGLTTGVHGVGASTVESVSGSQAKVDNHNALFDRHGATDANTTGRIIRRDGAGNAKVADGVVASDIATKGQVDTVGGNLTAHAALTTGVHGVGASTVESASGAQAKVDNHNGLTTGVHGVGASTVESIVGSQSKVDAHKDLTTGVHGAGASTLETIAGSQAKVDTHNGLLAPHASATSIGGKALPSGTIEDTAGSQAKVDTHDALAAPHPSATSIGLKGLPSGTIVGTSDAQNLNNKTLADNSTFFADDGDTSKKMQFECSGITAATTRTLTVPNESGTLVLQSRQINGGTTISGGGDLSANRTLAVVDNTNTQKVEVYKSSVAVGTRKRINLIPGSNVTLTVTDNAGADRVDVQVDSSPGISSQDLFGSTGQDSFTATNTTLTLSANAVKVMSAAYDTVLIGSPTNVTNNIGTAGPAANGRDQAAAFSSNNWIHFYWIWNGTTLASLSSLSATAPTLPSGYTHKCYAGAVRYRTSALDYIFIRGSMVYYRERQPIAVAVGATTETTLSISTYVPPNATVFLVNSNLRIATTAGGAGGMAFSIRHTSTYDYLLWNCRCPVASGAVFNATASLIPNKSQRLYYLWTGSTTNISAREADIDLLAYSIPNNGT